MFKKIAIMLEMIKFKHTVFAMPFALMGAILSDRSTPEFAVIGWIVLAMIGARTSAMGFNRIVDRKFDLANARTASRAIPAGEIRLWEAWLMVVISAMMFFFACYNLNRLTLLIAPFALGLTFFYSLTKRFTWLCHLVLGIALAFSPLGGWVAVKGSLENFPYILSLGVLFWVAGFDTIYACLDADFDRQAGLFSLPSRFGREGAFKLAVFLHVIAFVLFTLTGFLMELHFIYFIGIGGTAIALFYQHLIVNPRDLSRIRMSFFAMNGLISLTIFSATWLDLIIF